MNYKMLKDFKKLLTESVILLIFFLIALKVHFLILNFIAILFCIILTLHIGLTYPEQLKIVKSWIYGLVKWYDRQKVSNECEGKINLYSESLNNELIGKEFPKTKIKLVTGEEKDYFENGSLIIRVKDSGNPNNNLITVALRFFSKTLVPETKQYLHTTLSKSIDYFSVKKFLDEHEKKLNTLFYEEYYFPECQKEPKIKDCFSYYKALDDAGIFNKLFIQELVFLGRKAHFYLEPKDPKITKEVIRLMNFLKDIVKKEKKLGLTFTGELLKTGIVLVAKAEKSALGDPEPFTECVDIHIKTGIEDIYLLASGGKNIEFLKTLTSRYFNNNPKLEKIKEQPYLIKEGGLKALLVLYKNKQV